MRVATKERSHLRKTRSFDCHLRTSCLQLRTIQTSTSSCIPGLWPSETQTGAALGGKVIPVGSAAGLVAVVRGGALRGQARDLRQLLVLYDVWGRNAAPALAPAKFFDSLEKLGQGAPLKVPPASTPTPPSPHASAHFVCAPSCGRPQAGARDLWEIRTAQSIAGADPVIEARPCCVPHTGSKSHQQTPAFSAATPF